MSSDKNAKRRRKETVMAPLQIEIKTELLSDTSPIDDRGLSPPDEKAHLFNSNTSPLRATIGEVYRNGITPNLTIHLPNTQPSPQQKSPWLEMDVGEMKDLFVSSSKTISKEEDETIEEPQMLAEKKVKNEEVLQTKQLSFSYDFHLPNNTCTPLSKEQQFFARRVMVMEKGRQENVLKFQIMREKQTELPCQPIVLQSCSRIRKAQKKKGEKRTASKRIVLENVKKENITDQDVYAPITLTRGTEIAVTEPTHLEPLTEIPIPFVTNILQQQPISEYLLNTRKSDQESPFDREYPYPPIYTELLNVSLFPPTPNYYENPTWNSPTAAETDKIWYLRL